MTFAELSLKVDRALTFGRADTLGDQLKNRLHDRLPLTDVTFTLTPASAESEQIADTVRFVVSSFNLSLHHLIINETDQGPFVSMHIEMPGEITLDEAHRRASEVSRKLHQVNDKIVKVVIHTEPYGLPGGGHRGEFADLNELRGRIKQIVESFPGVNDCHNIILTPLDNGLALSADMRMDGSYSLGQTHQTSEQVEKKLRVEIPDLASITLHLEPLASPSSPPAW
jgi:divalent metal cation (Fe/Co/Zn/Cd) transporter